MGSQINCQEAICDHMIERYLKVAFEQRVQQQLRNLFNGNNINAAINNQLTFSVLSGMDSLQSLNPLPEETQTFSTMIICVFIFMFVMLILSLLAWLHNQNNLPFMIPG